MIGWIIAGGIVVVLWLLCLIRVGVYAKYEEKQFLLRLYIGPFSFPLFPREKQIAEPAAAAEEAVKQTKKEKKTFQKPNFAQIQYLLETLPGILTKALRRLGKGILVKPLRVRIVFAGEDPADTAQRYGKAQAFVSAIYPEVKRLLRVRDVKIALSADYQREEMILMAEAGVYMRIGTLVCIAFGAGWRLLRCLLGYRKLATQEPHNAGGETKNEHDQAAAA